MRVRTQYISVWALEVCYGCFMSGCVCDFDTVCINLYRTALKVSVYMRSNLYRLIKVDSDKRGHKQQNI